MTLESRPFFLLPSAPLERVARFSQSDPSLDARASFYLRGNVETSAWVGFENGDRTRSPRGRSSLKEKSPPVGGLFSRSYRPTEYVHRKWLLKSPAAGSPTFLRRCRRSWRLGAYARPGTRGCCLLYTSDAAADPPCVATGGCRTSKQKLKTHPTPTPTTHHTTHITTTPSTHATTTHIT